GTQRSTRIEQETTSLGACRHPSVARTPPEGRTPMPYRCDRLLVAVACVLLVPALAFAAGVTAIFDLSSPSTGPFPSDHFTVADATQNTGVRITLPKPACATRPSDCADIDVLNTPDGFNLHLRP